MKYYISLDNGVSGSVCILDESGKLMFYGPTPVRRKLNYTKAVGYSNRLDGTALRAILEPYSEHCTLVLERPMINPGRWNATVSAIRCDEATNIVIDLLGIKLIYVDSRDWQTPMLPTRPAVKGKLFKIPKKAKASEYLEEREANKALKAKRAAFALETKALSLAVGQRLFPAITFKKDADSAVQCEWARLNKL
jgi:hypothetical protein